MGDFQSAFTYTMKNEGTDYSNNPTDRGGPTRMGITLAILDKFTGTKGTASDIKSLTLDKAKQIYEQLFWSPLECDKIVPQPVAMALFDIGVNAGSTRAVRLLQTALSLPPDGRMGPDTLMKINSSPTNPTLTRFICEIQNYYIDIVVNDPFQIRFLQGWLSRSQRLLSFIP